MQEIFNIFVISLPKDCIFGKKSAQFFENFSQNPNFSFFGTDGMVFENLFQQIKICLYLYHTPCK